MKKLFEMNVIHGVLYGNAQESQREYNPLWVESLIKSGFFTEGVIPSDSMVWVFADSCEEAKKVVSNFLVNRYN